MVDSGGMTVTLARPAGRIISLAPHVTEMLYAAGAGGRVVGVMEHSDYPPAARTLPRVGGGAGLDLEAIISLRPDLIVAWQSGNPAGQIERLRDLGIPVYVTEPRHVETIADDIERLGRLAGTEKAARPAGREFRRHYHELQARYAGRPPVTVFYQILDASLLTINGAHLINEIIDLCGGRNVFAGARWLTPRPDMETLIHMDPDAVLASGDGLLWREWRVRWLEWPQMRAVKNGNLYLIPPDLVHRQGPRILQGTEKICAALEQARGKR